MPPLQSLQSLLPALTGNPTITALVAAEPEENIVIQRLNLRQDLAAEFLSAAKDSVPPANEEVRLRAYEAGYKPESDEVSYIELAQNSAIADLISQVSQVQQAELFHEDDEVIGQPALLYHRREPERTAKSRVLPGLQP